MLVLRSRWPIAPVDLSIRRPREDRIIVREPPHPKRLFRNDPWRLLGIVCWLFFGVGLAPASRLGAQERTSIATRKQQLETMLLLFARSDSWEAWLEKTGELPPDFQALPSRPFLPATLKLEDGNPVRTGEDWLKRRGELLDLFRHYVTGKSPAAPNNLRALRKGQREESGAIVQQILLEFGPEHRAQVRLELLVPRGKGPFPVFMTPGDHRRWALIAVSRGYIGCVYAGSDGGDDTANFPTLWPEADWTRLRRRAWAVSRAIDYLSTLPQVDGDRIALAGHSRNGKQSLIAAAFEPRIAAVISSSSGAGGACSYRFFSETQCGEGIERITSGYPEWLHPRLRFFAGRENKLPIDQHQLLALIAPRACLISTALADPVESVWAVEHTYRAVREVYSFLDAEAQLGLRHRRGRHETVAEDIEAYLDWLDERFGRKPQGTARLSEPIYPTYELWQQQSGEKIRPTTFPERDLDDLLHSPTGAPVRTRDGWIEKRREILERIQWALGESPPAASDPGGRQGAEGGSLVGQRGRPRVPTVLEKRSINFGNHVAGDLYFPAGASTATGKLPVLLWVHPFSSATGYVSGYRRGEPAHLFLARSGFAVFAFDQIGQGYRLEEARDFYRRYPRSSLLGKTLADISSAITALGEFQFLDLSRLYALGYGSGAMAALHATALDERIAGVVSVAGFTPMRRDTQERGSGGVARWSRWLPLVPRLGAFVGHESKIPYDYHEVLAAIAPRPVLVVAPTIDFQSHLEDIRACLEEVKKVYQLLGAEGRLFYLEVEEYNRFSPELQRDVILRFQSILKR